MKKILIVDDEDDIREILKEFCEILGCIAKTCSNGKEAFELLKNEKFDLIISDIKMPDMNGEKFVKKVREDDKIIPIIMCSGFIDDRKKEKFKRLGINGYIEKPFKLEEFKRIIEELN